MDDRSHVVAPVFPVQNHVTEISECFVSADSTLFLCNDLRAGDVLYEDDISDLHVWHHAAGFDRPHRCPCSKRDLGYDRKEYENLGNRENITQEFCPRTIAPVKFFHLIEEFSHKHKNSSAGT